VKLINNTKKRRKKNGEQIGANLSPGSNAGEKVTEEKAEKKPKR
jgi:hypothetical protein